MAPRPALDTATPAKRSKAVFVSLEFGRRRYVIYFAVSQILFLAGACFATGKNILAVRARKRVAARILALRHRIVNAQRSGELSSRRSSRGLIVEGRRASLRKSWGSLGAFTTSDSSFSRRVRLAAARKQRSLGDTERGDLSRPGRIESLRRGRARRSH